MSNMVEAQVIAAGVSYFSADKVLGPNGDPILINGAEVISTQRHEALLGDVVEMSQHEYDRLAALSAVRTPSSEPIRPEIPAATPFGVPMPTGKDGEMQAFLGPVMGHPAPSAGATDLEISRAQVAGALSPEESARLQEQALVGANDDSKEAIADRDYEGASRVSLEAEIQRRNAERDEDDKIVPEGTGKGGNVIKDDLVIALAEDDEENEE